MTRNEFRSALADLMGAENTLSDADTRDTIESWSSLVDVQILSMIQSDLAIDADEELIELATVGELLDALVARGALSS